MHYDIVKLNACFKKKTARECFKILSFLKGKWIILKVQKNIPSSITPLLSLLPVLGFKYFFLGA